MIVMFPAGTKVKNLRTGRYEILFEATTVDANYRGDDDVWVWSSGEDLYEVKLHPGD